MYPRWRQVVAGYAGIVSTRLTMKPAGYSLAELYFIFHFTTILKGLATKRKNSPVTHCRRKIIMRQLLSVRTALRLAWHMPQTTPVRARPCTFAIIILRKRFLSLGIRKESEITKKRGTIDITLFGSLIFQLCNSICRILFDILFILFSNTCSVWLLSSFVLQDPHLTTF